MAKTYQWRKDAVNISGATSASYSKANTTLADAGEYDVVVTENGVSRTFLAGTAVIKAAKQWYERVAIGWQRQGATAPNVQPDNVVRNGLFLADPSMLVDRIWIYCNGVAKPLTVGIYNSDGTVVVAGHATSANDWQSIPIASTQLNYGSSYALAFRHDTTGQTYNFDPVAGAGIMLDASPYAGGQLPTLGEFSATVADRRYSLYAEGFRNPSGTRPTVWNGGNPTSLWLSNSAVGGGTSGSGRTLVQSTTSARHIRRSGTITGCRLRTGDSAESAFRIRIYRWNGTEYDYISQQSEELTLPLGAATQDYTFAAPLAVKAGDAVGIWLGDNDAELAVSSQSGSHVIYGDGLLVDTSTVTQLSNFAMDLELLGPAMDLAITGDSIVEGHNGTNEYHGYLHTAERFGGDETCEIGAQIRAIKGTSWYYENHALGSQTFEWVAGNGMQSVLLNPTASIWIHCGVNDVASARTWSQVEDNLDKIRSVIPENTNLYISEILPWTNGDDTEAATIRTWNGYLATWCSANNATLIVCHDAMGKIRVSTGELDDLATAYDEDGVHLTEVGVSALAAIVAAVVL